MKALLLTQMKEIKDKLVATIMKETKSAGEAVLDKLCEHDERYLKKLLQVLKFLK
jgi:hypothetical protein